MGNYIGRMSRFRNSSGVSSQMRKFEYFFGANLVLIILKHTDNLSKTLQKTKMSASEGQVIAKMTVSTLQVNIYIDK